jgi:hypothetical protein
VTEEFNGIVLDLDERLYHAHSALSSSKARDLLTLAPRKARDKWNRPEPAKTTLDVGTAVHTKILGTGAKAVAYPPEHLTPSGYVSTKAATVEWAAQQRAQGLTPVTPETMKSLDEMAESVLAHPSARVLLEQSGHREASLFGTDPATGIQVRARFDFYPDDGPRPLALDLKSAIDASPRGFGTAVGKHKYHVQRGWYLDVNKFIGGHDLAEFLFVVVEKEPPYLVGVYTLPEQAADDGRKRARDARNIYAECLATGDWPGYSPKVETADVPYYYLIDDSLEATA